jgi:hypothetical protein
MGGKSHIGSVLDFLVELAQQLYERRHQAIPVPFRDCAGPDFAPIPQACHANVDEWCKNHPKHRAIRGWLVHESWLPLGFCRFAPHSVALDENGELFDLTPPRAAPRYPFLRNHLTDEEFVLMVSARQLVHLDHRFKVNA